MKQLKALWKKPKPVIIQKPKPKYERREGVGPGWEYWQRFYIEGVRVTFAEFYDAVHPHTAPNKNVITDHRDPVPGEVEYDFGKEQG